VKDLQGLEGLVAQCPAGGGYPMNDARNLGSKNNPELLLPLQAQLQGLAEKSCMT
jgi:hypothetical protein